MDFQWNCIAHVRSIDDASMRMIRAAGCWFLEIGMESGVESILRSVGRPATRRRILDAVRCARRNGLVVKGNFIIGLPGENTATMEETTAFAIRSGIDYFQMTFLTIWPGCPLAEDPARHGTVLGDQLSWSMFKVSFVPHGLTAEELRAASRRAFRRFYLRPRSMLTVLRLLSARRGMRLLAAAFVTFLCMQCRRASPDFCPSPVSGS
ncbi:radical SAM protein, partial [bacterium]|nr:radical SAM protein [candidate division CSSED10-310 bacterium]